MAEGAMVEERRRLLLQQVQDAGRVVASEAALAYGVSEDSIRRDLRFLAAEGLVQRVRGGALRAAVVEPFSSRAERPTPELTGLAEAVAQRLGDVGGVVVLDAGVTNVRVAESLAASSGVTVVTSSPAIGAAAVASGVEVLMLGGLVLADVGASVDATAVDGLRAIRADVAVLGVCGVDADAGVTTARVDEVAFKQAVVASGAELIVAASADKLGAVASYRVAQSVDITTVFSESLAAHEHRDAFLALGIEVVDV